MELLKWRVEGVLPSDILNALLASRNGAEYLLGMHLQNIPPSK